MKMQKGFSIVESLLVIVLAGIVILTGWYVWRMRQEPAKPGRSDTTTQNPSNNSGANNGTSQPSTGGNQSGGSPSGGGTTTNPATETVVKTKDGKVQFTLPADWTVVERQDGGNKCDVRKPNDVQAECVMWVSFKPKHYQSSNIRWTASVEKVTSQQDWHNDGSLFCDSAASINGYHTYNCVVTHGDYYLLTPDNRYVITFSQDDYKLDTNYDYDATFLTIVRSVRFN